MNKDSYPLSPRECAKIEAALEKYLHMDEENFCTLIEDIETTGGFRTFGYGSLIGDPASSIDTEYRGILPGWEKGPFCLDRHYRGTPDALGITMGALPTKDGTVQLPGLVQEIGADNAQETKLWKRITKVFAPFPKEERTQILLGRLRRLVFGESFAERILKNIYDFAKRETGLNPIYEYKIVKVEIAQHGPVKAIICAADPKNLLYLGRDGIPGGLTIEQKAAIIATSKGEPGSSPRNTGMAYWRDHIDCCKKAGFKPDPQIEKLVKLAEYFRAQLETINPELFAELEALEKDYNKSAYDVPVFSVSDDPGSVMELREAAIKAANLLKDPLTPDMIATITQHERELTALSLQ